MIAYHGTRQGRLEVGDYLNPERGIFRPGFVSVSLDMATAHYFADPERPAIATIELDDNCRGRGWAAEGDQIFDEVEIPDMLFEDNEVVIWSDRVARVINVVDPRNPEKVELETDSSDPELGQVGTVDVWVADDRDETYLGGWYGYADELARRLEDDEYFGLASYLKRADGYQVGYIAGMEVRRSLTGRGIGTAMIEACLDILRSKHVDEVFLHRSAGNRSSDEQLERLYRRIGFKNVKCCAKDMWPVMRMDL